MLRSFVIVFLAMLTTSLYGGPTGKIAGIVTDAATGEPLPGVNVVLEETVMGAATDLDGYYVILNVPPGTYQLNVSMIGYTSKKIVEVRVNIDQTTTINVELGEETLDIGETITVVAEKPVVEKDVAASRANITSEEIEAIPVVSVSNVVGLQAGIEGISIRDGYSSETAFMVDGLTLRDERNNTPYTAISLTSVEEMQVQAGGFSAEYGNIRSGIVNVVTKEGSTSKYSFAFLARHNSYSPWGILFDEGARPKHFGQSPNSPNSYWIRPYVDDDVAWTGTNNGNWDYYTRIQYPEFEGGWNAVSQKTLNNDDPNDDLTPEAAQQLFLFQHRRQMDIQIPDYSTDMSFSGPVPFLSKPLGNLRFHTSFRNSQSAYLIPLHDDAYRDYTWQLKLTSDVGDGKKLMVNGFIGRETGVDQYNNGSPGMFNASWEIASALSNGPKYIDARMFSTDYWGPATTDFLNLGVKWNHVVDDKTFYEASINILRSDYTKGPGPARDNTLRYKFGNNYYVDESPYGFEWNSTAGINGMRMGAGMSNARDSSVVTAYTLKLDATQQVDRWNNIKAGAEVTVTNSEVKYGRFDRFLPDGNTITEWDKTPVRAALYLEDKLEFEGMIASVGLRMDYSHAGGEWYDLGSNPYSEALSAAFVGGIDTLLDKDPTEHIFTFSPRIAVAFPVTENSKLYFNYGHFRQMPQPDDLYMFRQRSYVGNISRLGNPNADLQKTIAYELGYEQSLFDQYLIRAAGYYKDVSLQPRSISYYNSDGSVSYSVSDNKFYRDIRGFEITFNKNRGNWVRGFLNYTYMVSTYGYFDYGAYYENPADQRKYISEDAVNYYAQRKPKPRPYARANIDFFSPSDFGPKFAGFNPLGDWRLNFLANWKAGRYDTWVGGGVQAGIAANVQWTDYWNVDIRFSKNFRIPNFANIELFMDVSNLFNYKYMTSYGFVNYDDRKAYMNSLHYSEDTEGSEFFGGWWIAGDDQPGDYRKPGVEFTPIIIVENMTKLDPTDANPNYLYYVRDTGEHYWYSESESGAGSFSRDKSRTDEVYDNKAYIDMPNLDYFTFLNLRNIFWGVRISFDL